MNFNLTKNRTLIIAFFAVIAAIILYFSVFKKPHAAYADILSNPALQHNIPIQQWTTPNGVQVYFVPTEGLPLIDIAINLDAGSARDASKPGLALLTANLLDKGTTTLSADAIAEKFEDAGAQYRAGVDRDRAIIAIRSLSDPQYLNPVIAVLSELLTQPAFPDTNVEIEKNSTLVTIKQNLQLPNVVASQAFYKALYPDHPYAQPVCGTEAGVSAITKQDLVQFHQQYFVAKNTTIALVGGISKERATEIAQQISEKLAAGSPASPLPEVAALTQSSTVNIPFPAEQTHVLIGQPCAIQNDPDYFPLLVGNYILGGSGLTSVLFEEVRNQRGLVYHVSSRLLALQKPAPFLIQLQTKNTQTKEAIQLVNQILSRFVKDGPTEPEIAEAKEGIMRSFPVDISNNAKIIDAVSGMAFYKLPIDFLSTYQKRVGAVTAADIKSTFQRRIHPDKMALIVVGTTPP